MSKSRNDALKSFIFQSFQITEDVDATHHAPGAAHVHVVRVGWSTVDSSLHLGMELNPPS